MVGVFLCPSSVRPAGGTATRGERPERRPPTRGPAAPATGSPTTARPATPTSTPPARPARPARPSIVPYRNKNARADGLLKLGKTALAECLDGAEQHDRDRRGRRPRRSIRQPVRRELLRRHRHRPDPQRPRLRRRRRPAFLALGRARIAASASPAGSTTSSARCDEASPFQSVAGHPPDGRQQGGRTTRALLVPLRRDQRPLRRRQRPVHQGEHQRRRPSAASSPSRVAKSSRPTSTEPAPGRAGASADRPDAGDRNAPPRRPGVFTDPGPCRAAAVPARFFPDRAWIGPRESL